VALLFIAYPALAQEGVPLDEMVGEGTKGRYTQQQAQLFALRAVPGEVIGTDAEWENSHFYYEYTIKAPDDSIYEVEINANTGAVYEIEIEYLAPGAALPMSLIARDVAESLAAAHIVEKTLGARKPQVLGTVIEPYQREPAYRITVRKAAKTYEVFVHAQKGRIISVKEK